MAASLVDGVLGFTRGHVAATLDVLDAYLEAAGDHELSESANTGDISGAVHQVARRQGEYAAQSMEFARTLHRLGGWLLQSCALGKGPYEATPNEAPKAVWLAMQQLHSAGLVERGARDWQVTDPRIQWWLTGGAHVGPTLHLFGDLSQQLHRPSTPSIRTSPPPRLR